MKIGAILLSIVFYCTAFSQQLTQTIRGTITDKESKTTLPGASVAVYADSVFISGTVTDIDGNFRIDNIPVGRASIKISFIGYQDGNISNILITSAKEVIIQYALEESAEQLSAVEIVAYQNGEVLNDMATVSVRSFSVEETDRYAGSRGDPARMASNFAGVQGADDSRNDIVVRGNSPIGVLWRFEGIDIPNPNHFAIAGTTGGPVSIINNKYLNNSDFFTGAFPAEYGNSIAGVFDLNMRSGNNTAYEYSFQLGFLGTEVFAEGPLLKNNQASFLINYRYATLKLFDFMHIPIGTEAVPSYQDGAFKLHFPVKNGGVSFFGIGGKSAIDILVSQFTDKDEIELYGDSDRDQFFGTSMAVSGFSYGHQWNNATYGKATLAYSWQENHADHQLVYRDSSFAIDSIVPNLGYFFRDQKVSAIYKLHHKINNKHSFTSGCSLERYFYNHVDSNLNLLSFVFENRFDFQGTADFVQMYFQWKYKVTDALVFNGGIHGQIFTMNANSKALEPRAGVRYIITEKSSLNLGLGLHSQMLPSYQYTYRQMHDDGSYVYHNQDIGFMRSFHTALGYEQSFTNTLHMRVETYYQYLFDVPVEVAPSAFSLANEGSGFARFFPGPLQNTGTGKNYGVEFTLEKFFSNNFFYLLTGSVYNSKYTGSDGIERKTDFNGTFAANGLFGYELEIGNKNTLQIGGKLTYAGGKLASPVDIAATHAAKELVFIDSLTNTIKLKDYFRFDLKAVYRLNALQTTHEFSIDFVNMFNIKNVLGYTYAPDPANPEANPVREEYQLGFLPLFYYKIDF
jgi:hypothetical protein